MALQVSINCLFDVRNSHSQPQLAQDMTMMEMMKLAGIGHPVVVGKVATVLLTSDLLESTPCKIAEYLLFGFSDDSAL